MRYLLRYAYRLFLDDSSGDSAGGGVGCEDIGTAGNAREVDGIVVQRAVSDAGALRIVEIQAVDSLVGLPADGVTRRIKGYRQLAFPNRGETVFILLPVRGAEGGNR